MSYGSVRPSGRKADPPFPGLLRGLGQSRKKQSPGSFLDWTRRGKFPERSYYYKERFYTAP